MTIPFSGASTTSLLAGSSGLRALSNGLVIAADALILGEETRGGSLEQIAE